MGRNGESGAFGLAAARGGVAPAGVGACFARFGTGAGTSNVASDPLRDRTEGDAVDASTIVATRCWRSSFWIMTSASGAYVSCGSGAPISASGSEGASWEAILILATATTTTDVLE